MRIAAPRLMSCASFGFLVFGLLVLAAPAARAEEPEVPIYSVENIMPADGEAPEGWKVSSKGFAPEGAPTEDGLETMAEGAGLTDDNFYVEYRYFKNEAGQSVVVAMLDIDADPKRMADAILVHESEKGWRTVEIGSPMRLMVLSGPDAAAKALEKALSEYVIYRFRDLARNRMNSPGAMREEHGRAAVSAYAAAIRHMSPKAGAAYALTGVVHFVRATEDPKNIDAKEMGKAVAAWARSIKDSVPHPPRGRLGVFVAGRLGQVLLQKKTKPDLEDAIWALKKAVSWEREAGTNLQRFDNRYNLSCAYARQGKLVKAFEQLGKSLEIGKELLPGNHYRMRYENMMKDEDLTGMRSDPRFKELAKKYAPPEQKKPAGHPPAAPNKPEDPE